MTHSAEPLNVPPTRRRSLAFMAELGTVDDPRLRELRDESPLGGDDVDEIEFESSRWRDVLIAIHEDYITRVYDHGVQTGCDGPSDGGISVAIAYEQAVRLLDRHGFGDAHRTDAYGLAAYRINRALHAVVAWAHIHHHPYTTAPGIIEAALRDVDNHLAGLSG